MPSRRICPAVFLTVRRIVRRDRNTRKGSHEMSRKTTFAARIAGLALAAAAPLAIAATPAHASATAQPDLDVTQCSVVRDYTNWGDGINWYHFNVTYTNEGNAPSGPFRSAVQPVWSLNGVFQNGNEVRVEFDSTSLNPGQSVAKHYWVTEKVVNQRTWGIFLDINHQVNDSQVNDNFCSYWVNNT